MRARTLSSTLASQPRPTIRPRAQSCHPSTAAYVRQEQERHEQNLILRKLRSAEEAVSSLRALLVLEEEAYSSSSSSSDGGGYVEEDWEVVSRRKKKPAAGDRSSTLKKRRGQPVALVPLAAASPAELRVQQGLALAYVHQFILSVQSVLTAIRLELPSLGSLSASSAAALEAMADLLQQSSGSPGPEVLPAETGVVSAKAVGQGDTALASSWRSASNTMSDLYGKLDDSKRACLAKVAAELAALQNLLVQSSSPSPTLPAADPALPGLTRQASVREYFVAESDKIAQTLSATSSNLLTLSTEAADTLSAGLTRVVDEASELTTLLTQSSTVAFDEAARIYHAAVEGGRRRLLSYDELPEGWKNNQHILSGYRFIGIDRWGAILRSAFQFHNETINIHSHFFGFLSLVYISIFILPSSPAFATEDTHWGDKGIFILFVAAGMKCLLCSTAWHLLSGCATGGWHRGAACVDYVGISGLIAASVMGMEVCPGPPLYSARKQTTDILIP